MQQWRSAARLLNQTLNGDVVEDTDLRSPRHNKVSELGSAAGGNANQLNRDLSLMVKKERFILNSHISFFFC